MIVAVTPNPAWDVTYHLERLAHHRANRPLSVAGRAGGKGINVARVLHSLGVAVTAVAPLGGATGERIRADLVAAGLALTSVPVSGETRNTTTIVETASGGATSLNELGPARTTEDWARLVGAVAELLPAASVLVLSGSLPPGVPVDGYAELVRAARAARVPVLLDASGPALVAGVAAGPDVVKPNADELRAATGESDPLRAVARLSAGTRADLAVVASFGPDGVLAATDVGWWRAVPPDAVRGNATGAGDAAVAALARGMAEDSPWPERLRDAVALSAAAVAAPAAGDVAGELYRSWRPRVRVDAVEPPG
ncbi:1-phosphofructokinase family hexose kinase [Embleya sp. AB8]|uniref:1-phosphofructokinase family hexose kinase n=1 Tax=Embleya sp. AB8 TaxID=3156304 RepID=UPI003C7935B4